MEGSGACRKWPRGLSKKLRLVYRDRGLTGIGASGKDAAMIGIQRRASNFFREAVPTADLRAPQRTLMLQRKQTLFLLLAAICGILTFFFPVETFVRGDQTFFFHTTGLFMADGTAVVDAPLRVPFFIVIGFLTAVLVVAIFLYKNRQRQVTVVRTVNLLLMAVVVFLFITGNSIRAYLEQGGHVEEHFGASIILPLVMLVLVFLAEHGIRKDEALVRSTERLR